MFCVAIAQARDWYASPDGSSRGSGSISSPWDLRTALSAPAAVQPGDTIWMRGGIYSGTFNSYLSGTTSSPIVVRQYPGERAAIAGALIIGRNGDHDVWFWGFEVFNRGTSVQGDGVTMSASGLSNPGFKLINMVIHDNQANGVGFWAGAIQGEVYGSLIYNNGFDGCIGSSCRGHGHGLYVQSTDSHRIADNIVFRNFSEGTQLYGSVNAARNNVSYEGNVFFNSGELSALNNGDFNSYNMWIGGDQVSQNTKLIDNYCYSSAPLGHNQYYNLFASNNALVTGNYFFTPAPDRQGIYINSSSNTGLHMTGNTFYGALDFKSSSYPNNTYLSARPTGKNIFVRANHYEIGRANIVVYNWDLSPSVTVDISASGLHLGQTYEIRDSQNFYGAPVAKGIYNGGSVTIPMSNLTLAPPEGTVPNQPRHTAPEFDVFILIPTGSQPGDTTPPTVSILSPGPNQTLSGTFNVTATASDNVAVARVQFKLDGANLGSPVTSVPYQINWNTATTTNGSHSLTAVATDTSNNSITSTAVAVTVNNYKTAPTVSITAPSANQTVSRGITITATASDNVGVTGVQFKLDGTNLGSVSSSAPYQVNWNTTGATNGTHSLTAVASDAAGNLGTASVTVTVSNVSSPPTGTPSMAYWSFDTTDISGNLALDRSANHLNATMYNMSTTAGKVGQALNFNGSNSYLMVPGGGLNLNSDFTLAAWIKTSNSSRREALLSKYDAGGTEAGYLLTTSASGTLGLQLGASNQAAYGNRLAKDSTPINDGVWHHIAVVITLGQDVKFYIDGTLRSTLPVKAAAASNGSPFEMGTLPFTYYGNYFTGSMDEVRVYHQALNASDIALIAGRSMAP